jgi:hypothetical protein
VAASLNRRPGYPGFRPKAGNLEPRTGPGISPGSQMGAFPCARR